MTARRALLVIALVAEACQGGPRATGRHAQARAMRALLERYSPSGYYIVTTFEGLPRRWRSPTTNSAYGVRYTKEFDDYFDDGSPENLVDNMGAAIRQVDLNYADLMAQKMIRARGRWPSHASAVYVDGDPILVTIDENYPWNETDSTFPADARTERYELYRSADLWLDAHGLLAELSASYHESRTVVDFWPWVRDEAPASKQLLVNYIISLHEMWVQYAELRLFLLHYLLYARDHHPDVYRLLIANQSFRQAFAATDDAYAGLLAQAAELEPAILAFAKTRGLDVELEGDQLIYGGSSYPIRDKAYPGVVRALQSEAYQEILAELR